MHDTLYVANVPAETTEEDFRGLFGEYGEVKTIQFSVDEKFNRRIALVQMASEKVATKANHGLNGHVISEHYLSVSYPDLNLSREFTAKQRKTVETIAAERAKKMKSHCGRSKRLSGCVEPVLPKRCSKRRRSWTPEARCAPMMTRARGRKAVGFSTWPASAWPRRFARLSIIAKVKCPRRNNVQISVTTAD